MTSRRNPRNYETSPLLPHPPHINSHFPLLDYISFSFVKNSDYTFQFCSQIIPVIFAVFINLLDAVTFGTCFFPAILGKTSSLAIDLFLLSTLVVQLVLVGMSSFQCGLGTSMAENIPFIHTMALGVYESMKSSHTVDEMMPTILITLCVSTILNGLAFYLVGYFEFGYILHFFPRHVILGMTFGFGIFLLLTGFQVTTGIQPDANILFNIAHMGWNNLIQFSIVCILEIVLRVLSRFEFGETAGPMIMFIIPVFFYVVLWFFNISFEEARDSNWLFPLAPSTHGWDMWNEFLNSEIHWGVVLLQLPTILSLTAFTLLLVPIRIPTLSMITGDEVDFDSELKAQGMGNILSGILGSVHNYLSYSNSVFFYNIGGTGKTPQLFIAILTGVLFLVGPQIINMVPRIIAGVIMLHLAFDLLNDSTIASRRALDSLEYSSVLLVGAVVTFFGFVPGIVAGGVSACVTFVVQSSKGSNVRGVFTGEVVRSNTSWTGKHRDKLEQGLATHGVYVIQLQGHIFFGNIQQIVKTIEQIIQEGHKKEFTGLSPYTSPRPISGRETSTNSSGVSSPMIEASYDEEASISPLPDPSPEYVVLDCSFVSGLDGNAVDGLLKLQRLLQADDYTPNPIFLTFAGLQASFQEMFSVHLTEFSKRFGTTADNDDFLSTFEPSERTRLLSLSLDDEKGVTLNMHTTYQPTEMQGLRRDMNDSVAQEILKRKSRPKPKFKRMRSEPPNQFHSDVNTALQVVEEHIIDSVDSPRRSPYHKGDEQNPLHTSDSFRRLDSFDELESFVSDAQLDANISNESNHSPENNLQLVVLPSIHSDSRRRAKSHPVELSSSYIPDDSFIPSSIKIVSPLKDISRSKHLFSTTELSLPLTIGMSHGVCGLVTSTAKQVGSISSPRETLLSLANDERSSVPLENISPSRPPSNLPTNLSNSPHQPPESNSTPRELSLEIPDVSSNENSIRKSDGIKRRIKSLLRELSPTGDMEVLSRLAGHLRKQVITVDEGERLWSERDPAIQMGFLISGRLEAVIGNQSDRRTLQVIIPGTFMGELGFLSGKIHSRTIIAKQPSMVALLTKEILTEIENNDIELLCTLQKLALKTAAWRSCQLMLFSAGSLGPK